MWDNYFLHTDEKSQHNRYDEDPNVACNSPEMFFVATSF